MDSYRVNLYQLAIFREVIERKSLTRAAETFHVSQPVVSRIVRALEREYGLELTRREGNALLPTQAGEAVLRLARESLSAHDEARDAIRQLTGIDTGQLRIGITTSAYARAADFLARFYSHYPSVNVRVDSSVLIADDVREGLLDVGIVIASQESLLGLRSIKLWSEEMVPIVAPDHPILTATHDPELWESVAIMTTGSSGHRTFVVENLLPQLPAGPEYMITQRGSQEFLRELTREGVGVAVLPFSTVEHDLATGRAVRLPIPSKMHVVMHLIQRPSRVAPPLLDRFRADLTGPAARAIIRSSRRPTSHDPLDAAGHRRPL